MPYVYLAATPIWLALTGAWTWNTYYKNALHARDLHRLMSWVPIIESLHALLSLFNYISCPWETTLSLIYATFWHVPLPRSLLPEGLAQHDAHYAALDGGVGRRAGARRGSG